MHRALMARQPFSKELSKQLQPLIPAFTPSAKGGARKLGVSDEAALNGILFVLHTGIAWQDLPQSLGYGSGMTCWRRLRDWSAAGVWERTHGWFAGFGKLRIRFETRLDIHLALLKLTAAIICARFVDRWC